MSGIFVHILLSVLVWVTSKHTPNLYLNGMSMSEILQYCVNANDEVHR